VYLRCTLRFAGANKIRSPSAPDIELELFLPGPDPRRIMLFRYPNGAVAEQYRYPLERHAGEKHFHCEGVPESMGMRLWHASPHKQPVQRPLITRGAALGLTLARPKEMPASRRNAL
jgi:hypothetical protein